jgi:hypothetical protein
MISSDSVQEWFAGCRLSSQMPNAAPSSVGTTTDQPMSPIMPKPNQTPCAWLRRARSFRDAFAPTSRLKAVGPLAPLFLESSLTVELREAA